MRAPKVRNAKQRGKQYNSNLAQGSPTRNAVKYYRGLRIYFDGKKNVVLYFVLGYPTVIFVLLKIRYGLPGTG